MATAARAPRSFVRSPGYVAGLVVGALVLAAPTARTHLLGDDFELIASVMVDGPGAGWFTDLGPNAHLRPFMWAWFWLGHEAFGVGPLGWHLAAALLYGLGAWLVALLARSVLLDGGAAEDDPWLAAVPPLAGVLFLVSPAHAEPLAWGAAASDLLVAVLGLGSLLCWARWRREGGRWHWAAGALCLLALYTKESALVLPAWILAYELLLPRPGHGRRASLRAAWPGIAPVGAAVVVYLVHYALLEPTILTGEHGVWLDHGPVLVVRRYVQTVGRAVLPAVDREAWPVVVGLLVVGLVAVALTAVRGARRGVRPVHGSALAFLAVAWLLSALPVATLGVSPFTPGGERLAYVPSAFTAILVAAALTWVRGRWRRVGTFLIPSVVVLGAVGLVSATTATYVPAGDVTRALVDGLDDLPPDQPVTIVLAPDTIGGAFAARDALPGALIAGEGWTDDRALLVAAGYDLRHPDDTVEVSPGSCSTCVLLTLDDPEAAMTFPLPEDLPIWFEKAGIRIVSLDDRSIELDIDPAGDHGPLRYFSGGELRTLPEVG